ncbi:hypothetical protein BSKO_00818 [Bryopsis sp. KO-2023]|nr:hypothetical protein BSKO_00818 [Bryopsis sp. KO-2023]
MESLARDQMSEAVYPLTLSFLAGLSTVIGGGIAVIKKPDEGLLALLLGLALGVMATLSVIELMWETGRRQGILTVMLAGGLGTAVYYLLRKLFPEHDHPSKDQVETLEMAPINGEDGTVVPVTDSELGNSSKGGHARRNSISSGPRLSPPELWRLGMLMALTMTLHNMPEGFAVAFSAMTDLGPIMALSIAMHNIPEGVIIAGPVFAATGSRWKAVGLAFASGMSEPLGACLAVSLIGPVLTHKTLDWMLTFVGGIMLSVCVLELWPEGRKCRNDMKFAHGIVFGSVMIAATLFWGS